MSNTLFQSELARTYRLIMAVTAIAVVAIVSHAIIPDRQIELKPKDSGKYKLFFDGESGGKTLGQWDDRDAAKFTCEAMPDGPQFAFCGVAFRLSDFESSVDLSRFDTFHAKIQLDGTAALVRIFTRSYIPGLSSPNDWGSMKSLNTVMTKNEAKDIKLVPGDWHVGEYWKSKYSPSRENTYTDFSRIHEFGVDIMPPIPVGKHTVTVNSFVASGEWIPATQWYLGVALAWLLLNFAIVAKKSYSLQRRISMDSHRIDALAGYSEELRGESEKYKELSSVDNLTGAMNRNGMQLFMNKIFPDGTFHTHLALIVIDLDHFKLINDKKGHDVGDDVLQKVADTIHGVVRAEDGFCRWGGEEFLLICPNTNERDAYVIAEKIRRIVSDIKFTDKDKDFNVTASLGVGIARADETFEDLFKRVDKALYEAKSLGRNCVNRAA